MRLCWARCRHKAAVTEGERQRKGEEHSIQCEGGWMRRRRGMNLRGGRPCDDGMSETKGSIDMRSVRHHKDFSVGPMRHEPNKNNTKQGLQLGGGKSRVPPPSSKCKPRDGSQDTPATDASRASAMHKTTVPPPPWRRRTSNEHVHEKHKQEIS